METLVGPCHLSGMWKGHLGILGRGARHQEAHSRVAPGALGTATPRGALSLWAGKTVTQGRPPLAGGPETAGDAGDRRPRRSGPGSRPEWAPGAARGRGEWGGGGEREAPAADSPICPMNSILMPWCSSRLLGCLSARLTFPETVSPS